MCLIAFAWKAHPRFPLVVVANRDEYFRRPTTTARWWPAPVGIFAGRDQEAGGTWLGVAPDGRFAALTNFRDPTRHTEGRHSRGQLVVDALTVDDQRHWLDALGVRAHDYNPFNLLAGNRDHLYVFESVEARYKPITPGIHGLSNHLLDTPWPKVRQARDALGDALSSVDSATGLVHLLRDDHPCPDANLPHTGVPLEWERALSSCFIRAPGYGTRSTSVVMIDANGYCQFAEQTWDAAGQAAGQITERFRLRALT